MNLIDTEHVGGAGELVRDAVRKLGGQVCVLHMKDYLPQPEAVRPRPVPCGQGEMDYRALLELARERELPMLLENTAHDNAEETRLWLEKQIR